ncbi:MAG: response regulator [Desulfatiglans sp.]|nr:response regulator [Thermodesulfobacteriota bacterium]MEE4352775.1 response regulator [Desulfatiglans sp.]
MARILFVDDEIGFLKAAQRHFRKSDHEILTAENGSTALALMEDRQIDLVILDYMMPEMDGIETFDRLREITPSMPVIMCTAHGSVHLAVEFMKSRNAVYFLEKPLDFMILAIKIEEALKVADKQRKLEAIEVANAAVRENLRTLQTLAGGISHEINNALTVVAGNIELIKLGIDENSPAVRHFDSLKVSVQRMSYLTKQLLAYAQEGKYQSKIVPLCSFLIDAVPLIVKKLQPRIKVDLDLTHSDIKVEADLTQMHMVISSIVANAVDAIAGRGAIKIRTRRETIDENSEVVDNELEQGRYLCIEIEDNGRGMDESTRRKVFEPFFSTKFQGRGLGMAAAYGIVKNHGGAILLDSEPDKGTLVRVYMPIAAEKISNHLG